MDIRKKSILTSTIGNLVEWYDWFAYSVFSIYFAKAFFPSDTPSAQLLQTAGIFAIGFLMRPLGGWLFGSYSDRYGRKKAMTLSILMMCSGSLLIACSPTYETIGIFAPIFLLLARMLQGFSLGGEEGSVATYLSESAPPEKRGLYASFQAITITFGQVLALGMLILLQEILMTPEQLYAFGWRIPFIIGAVLAVIGYYLRYNLCETQIFLNQKVTSKEKRGSLKNLLQHKKAILRLFFITLGGTVAYYAYTAYMFKYLIHSLHFERSTATYLSFSTLIIFLFIQPVFGKLSDKIGRRPLLVAFGAIGTLGTIPMFIALEHVDTPIAAFALMLSGLIVLSLYTSIKPVAKAELFPTDIRALGASFPSAIITALFGGTVEYVGLHFQAQGQNIWFYAYVSFCVFVSWFGCYWMEDPKKTSLIDKG